MNHPPPTSKKAADARLQSHDQDAYRRLVFVNRPKVRAIRLNRSTMLDGNSVKAGEVVLILPTTPPPDTCTAGTAALALEDGWADPLTEDQLAARDAAEAETGVGL